MQTGVVLIAAVALALLGGYSESTEVGAGPTVSVGADQSVSVVAENDTYGQKLTESELVEIRDTVHDREVSSLAALPVADVESSQAPPDGEPALLAGVRYETGIDCTVSSGRVRRCRRCQRDPRRHVRRPTVPVRGWRWGFLVRAFNAAVSAE